ncbi:MAG: hypothetical protein AAFX85_08815 [Pseudomonadota bacterium]
MMRYLYLGDLHTRPDLRGQRCDPVMRSGASDKPVVTRGRNRNSLVVFENGERHVVAGRHL